MEGYKFILDKPINHSCSTCSNPYDTLKFHPDRIKDKYKKDENVTRHLDYISNNKIDIIKILKEELQIDP